MRRLVSTLASVSLIVGVVTALESPAGATPPANAVAVASGSSALPDQQTLLTANEHGMVWETLNAANQPVLWAQKLDNGAPDGDPIALTGGNFTHVTANGSRPGLNLSIAGSMIAAAGDTFSSFGTEQQRISMYDLATDNATNPIITGFSDGGGFSNQVFFAGAAPDGLLFLNLIPADGDTPAAVHVVDENQARDNKVDLGALPDASTDPTALAGVTAATSPDGSVIAYPTTLTDDNDNPQDNLVFVPYNGDDFTVLATGGAGSFDSSLVTGGGNVAWANYLISFLGGNGGCNYFTLPLDGSGNGQPTNYNPPNFCNTLGGITDTDMVFAPFPIFGGQTGADGPCPVTVQTCASGKFATLDLLDGSVHKSSTVNALSAATDGTTLFVSHGTTLGTDPGDAGIYTATSATSAETLVTPAAAKALTANQVALSPGQVTWTDDSTTDYPVSTRSVTANGLSPTLGDPQTVAATTVPLTPYEGYGVAASGKRTAYAVPPATQGGKDGLVVQVPGGGTQTVTTFNDGTPFLTYNQPAPSTVQVSGSNVLYLTANATAGYDAHVYSTVTHGTQNFGPGAAFALSGGYLAWVGNDGSVMRQDLVAGTDPVQLRPPTTLTGDQTLDQLNAEVTAAGDYVGWLVRECIRTPEDFTCQGVTEAAYRNAATLDPAHIVLSTATTPDQGTNPLTPQHIAMSADYLLIDEVNLGFQPAGTRGLVWVKLSDASTGTVANNTQFVSGAGKFAADGSNAAWIDPSGTPEIMALDTNSDAPRVLTVDAPSTVTPGGDPGAFEIVASAPLTECTIDIKSGDTVVRSLDCSAADGDGVVTWDGKDTGGTDVPAGPYTWTITGANGALDLLAYDGSDDAITGTVNVVSPTTTTGDWPDSITYGRAYSVGVEVTSDGGTPTGDVTLTVGNKELAHATLSDGTATLDVDGTAVKPGSHTLTLSYGGSDTLGASSDSRQVTIAKASTKVHADWPAHPTYGKSFKVPTVVTAKGITPTGTVTLKEGHKTLASHKLSHGAATLKVGGKQLDPGRHKLTLKYEGSGLAKASSTTEKLTVRKASARVRESLDDAHITTHQHAKLTVTVSASGTTPTGTVRVYQGKTRIASGELKHGEVVITLPKLSKGKHKIHATYGGSATVHSATGDTLTLTVRAP